MQAQKVPAELWDKEQLMAHLGCTGRFAQRLTEEGRIRFIRIGRENKFDPADVADYIEREKTGPTHASVSDVQKPKVGWPAVWEGSCAVTSRKTTGVTKRTSKSGKASYQARWRDSTGTECYFTFDTRKDLLMTFKVQATVPAFEDLGIALKVPCG